MFPPPQPCSPARCVEWQKMQRPMPVDGGVDATTSTTHLGSEREGWKACSGGGAGSGRWVEGRWDGKLWASGTCHRASCRALARSQTRRDSGCVREEIVQECEILCCLFCFLPRAPPKMHTFEDYFKRWDCIVSHPLKPKSRPPTEVRQAEGGMYQLY